MLILDRNAHGGGDRAVVVSAPPLVAFHRVP